MKTYVTVLGEERGVFSGPSAENQIEIFLTSHIERWISIHGERCTLWMEWSVLERRQHKCFHPPTYTSVLIEENIILYELQKKIVLSFELVPVFFFYSSSSSFRNQTRSFTAPKIARCMMVCR